MDWIKYHSQLQTTNNIIYVLMSSGLPWKYSHSVLPKVISGHCTIMPRDNSNGLSQYTIAQGQLLYELNNVQFCHRTTPMDFYNIQLLKDNSNELNNNDNAKGQLQWTSTIFNCSRTTLMSSTTTTMPKDNSNGLQSTFAKDNSFGLGEIDNDMLLSTWGQAKSFVILFPMWG